RSPSWRHRSMRIGDPRTRRAVSTSVNVIRVVPPASRSKSTPRSSTDRVPSISSGGSPWRRCTIHTVLDGATGTSCPRRPRSTTYAMAVAFVDECSVQVTAGRGGDGSSSLHSEPFKPRGGPDGGNGGPGGSVIFEVAGGVHDLSWLGDHPHQTAKPGAP